jgi:hypothetical protein
MEKTNGKLDPKQRESLARMLTDAKDEERSKLEKADGISASSILRALADEVGALNLVKKVEESRSELKKGEKHLADLGFEVSDSGELELKWDAPDRLKAKYEERTEKGKPSIEKSLKKYDLAIIGVWTAETAAEAKKIVEDLI